MRIITPEEQELLWDYSNWLFKEGYIDTDYYSEEPTAVDDYIQFKLKEKI